MTNDLPAALPDTIGKSRRVCAVVGVGPGTGAAFARCFAQAGYAVALLARSTDFTGTLAAALPDARAYVCDATDPQSVAQAFADVARDLGPVDVLIYNAGKAVFGTAEDVTLDQFEEAWRLNALGAFAAARAVIPAMKQRASGTIIFVGATASRRGAARTAAFAPAKAAQHSLAQSLARHLGPSGVHVALIVVDGAIDEPVSRARQPGKPDSFFIQPDAIAETAAMLVRQTPSAWSFELDVRPAGETW